MKICVFEDEKYENLYPLTLARPAFELKCGYVSLWERMARNFEGTDVCFFLRPDRDYLVPTFKRRVSDKAVNDMNSLTTDDILLINGRWLMGKGELEPEGTEEVGLCGEDIVYARAKQRTIEECMSQDFKQLLDNLREKLAKRQVEPTLISYPWDLINNNPEAMGADFEFAGQNGISGRFSPQAVIYGGEKTDVFVAEKAEVQPFVVLDVTEGPIFIDEGATIFPDTRIEGPAYIGKDTRIVGGKIREGCSIGPVCRVGGEVEESIIHGYSNKYHDGFLGHSYVCEWVNLGALTTNSDLKNDYTEVEVYIKGKLMNSGNMKVGSFIGDHTKTAIGCLLNTGTVIGVMSNVLHSDDFPKKKFIPSFSTFHQGRFIRARLKGEKGVLKIAEKAMGRRDVEMTDEDRDLYRELFSLTEEERNKLIKETRRR
jgi:UDP-N-acetylglucosamine diphosphorylase/glucosamine-1-phosphate N-acetyltransferase